MERVGQFIGGSFSYRTANNQYHQSAATLGECIRKGGRGGEGGGGTRWHIGMQAGLLHQWLG